MNGTPISAPPAPGLPDAAAPAPAPKKNAAVAEMAMRLTVDTDDAFAGLLELAADDDADGLLRALDRAPPAAADEPGLWYGRRKALERRTPLMVAATYGSLAALRLLLSLPSVDANRRCGPDGTTALHCAASGGSPSAVDAVRLLLVAGADADATDAAGCRPADVISVPPKMIDAKIALQDLLGFPKELAVLRVATNAASLISSPVSSPTAEDAMRSPSAAAAVMMMTKFTDLPRVATSEKKEYPVDPSLPDIKSSIYASDEFRMYSFKIRPCSRAYSHDWTECPFVHPGENARRRDPRKYHYSCVPCPDFRKGVCRRSDMCEYAHGVFECWLHPAQYRTRLCKDGTGCNRRVCFFAHTTEELRPLYVSTGSAVPSPSPRASATAAMDMAAAMGLMPGSPSAVSAAMSPFTPPRSPSGNGMPPSLGWQQPNVPTLHLPGSSLQSSRLRSSLNARDMPLDDYSLMQEMDSQLMNGLCARLGSSSAGNHASRTKSLNPSNLDDLFSAEMISSPRYSNADQGGAMFSPSQKAAILNQFQQQQQALLSPINTGGFSPKTVDNQQIPSRSLLLQASLGMSSPGRMSPRCVESGSPMNSHMAAAFAQREKQLQQQHQQQQQTMRSLSSRDLGPSATRSLSSRDLGPSAARASALVGSPLSSSWSKWGSPSGAPDWGVDGEELGKLRRSSSFELRSGGDDPDLSWVHTLVKESPPEKQGTAAESMNSVGPSPLMHPNVSNGEGSRLNTQMDGDDQATIIGALLEQMQLDQQMGSLAT